MSLFAALAATLALAGPSGPGVPPVTVKVDSARHEVVITTGPWKLPNMPPMDHAMMDMGADAPLQRFAWPVDGWFRGFKYELVDEHGTVLDRRIMHHMIMVNFDRRQLLYSAIERIAGAAAAALPPLCAERATYTSRARRDTAITPPTRDFSRSTTTISATSSRPTAGRWRQARRSR